MIIIIPTHNRTCLLGRTLASLSLSLLPDELHTIVIIENGQKTGDTEALVSVFKDKIPVHYAYSPVPNKSHSLNVAIGNYAQDELVVFFDDDVRLAQGTIMAYAKAAQDTAGGAFYAGRVDIDYEDPSDPQEYLIPFLPACSLGWNYGKKVVELKVPHGLGCNWAAFSSDIRAVGGFCRDKGPGANTNSAGQETDMQSRLMKYGAQGYYLPEARIWHFVEKGRCTPEWLLRYAYRHGISRGLDLNDEAKVIAGIPLWTIKRLFKLETSCLVKMLFCHDEVIRFAEMRQRAVSRGMIKGCRLRQRSAARSR